MPSLFLVNFVRLSLAKKLSTALVLFLFCSPFHTFDLLNISHFNIFVIQIIFLLVRLPEILHFVKNLVFLGLFGRLRLVLSLGSMLAPLEY